MTGPKAISKVLSPNDVGETGTHQAGFLIPKSGNTKFFFPPLDGTVKNPRHNLVFYDEVSNRWEFSFIYYNGKKFGGTRDEYRLTGLTKFFSQNKLVSGDTIILSRDDEDRYIIHYKRSSTTNVETITKQDGTVIKRLKVSNEWTIVDYS